MTDAPFPYFGGKKAVASIVWQALGDVKHFMEPFFGSGAVLLNRPAYDPTRHIETINDADAHVANVWRALQFDPDGVARWCDWPVNHVDLSSRKRALNAKLEYVKSNMIADDGWFDAKLAGYWIWAASCWIGHGLVRPNQIPHLTGAGMGVHKLSQIPHLGNQGMGVHKLSQRPRLGDTGRGVQDPHNPNIYKWFRELSERLRHVRVVCGDWKRICGGNWQNNMGTVGMFFDPPYGRKATRDSGLYSVDSLDVADEVCEWCLNRGSKKSHRIVLAGYFEEHESLLNHGWSAHKWKAQGGYSNRGKGKNKNRFREALFFSPHCLADGQSNQAPLPLAIDLAK